jgi:MinD-like ATPase involved in chromosome partitioning or flagellar assembly
VDVRITHETTVRQATWTRAVSILVNNPKGGTGKTPTALLLGGVLAAIRGGSVAILEVSDDPGALNFRAEGDPQLGLGELVRDITHVRTAGRLAGYTAPQTSFASVIGSTGRRERLTGDSVIAVTSVIDEFYGIRVMDSGNVTTSSAFQGAVSVSDVLVIPVMNAGDSVLEAIQLLEELRDAGGASAELANRAIAVRLTDGRPENEAVRQEVERLLTQTGVIALHEIPYDSHIAERGPITLARLNPATRDAFTAAAASVVRSLQSAVSSAPSQTRKA